MLFRIDDDLDAPGALEVADRLAGRLVSAGAGGSVGGAELLAELLDVVGAASAADTRV